MFENNALLRASHEKISLNQDQLLEWLKCSEDILYFATNYVYIQTLDHGFIIPEYRQYQKKILKALSDKKYRDNRKNAIMMQPRQSAKTTTSVIFILWSIIFKKDITTGIVACKLETAVEIVSRLRESYTRLPLWMQPGIETGGWSKKSIKLANGCRVVSSAGSGSGLRGYTLNILLADEFAFLPRAEEFARAMFPVVSSGSDSQIIVASTPKGLNYFADLYTNAISQTSKSDFFPIRVYEHEVPRPGGHDAFKKKIIEDMGYLFYAQEFDCKLLGSAALLVDGETVEQIHIKNPIKTMQNDSLLVYEYPKPNNFYILGVDSAEGTKLDSSIIQVLKFESNKKIKQVAMYRSNSIHPKTFAQIVVETAKMYNNAYVMIENNAIGSLVCDTIWNTIEYDKIVNTEKRGLGFKTTHKSKVQINMTLKQYMEKGWLKLCDKTTKHELSVFQNAGENIWKATTGNHDDTVMALAIGLNFVNTIYYDENDFNSESILNKLEEEHEMPNIHHYNNGVDYTSNTTFGKDDEDDISDLFTLFANG